MPRRTLISLLAATLLVALGAGPASAHDDPAGTSSPLHDGGGMSPFTAAARPAATAPEPPARAAPRADCNDRARPEPGMQGRVPKDEVDSGRADAGYWCNVSRIGQIGETGGFRVHRYTDSAGRECAYYDTTLLFPTNTLNMSLDPTGVAVLDMSDPRNPVRTATLVTPAMQSPHESLNISVRRGVLAAVLGNPTMYPGGIDVYDLRKDCRHPEPMSAAFPATPFGHESGMAPDGMTFYPSSSHSFSAVDISNPRIPRTLTTEERFRTHGLSVSPGGNRGYLASLRDGLVIVDLSEVQRRKPNPQIREISRLSWSNMTIPQNAIPVTIKGRPYVVEVDEYSTDENGDIEGHGDRVGAARIIDISDERRPRVVSNIRLQVHQKPNRDEIGGDYGAQNPTQGYAAHYCDVPRRVDPGIVACSMILSGLRLFDIRDPLRPREIAYHVAPPSHVSETGGPFIDERANWAMSQPTFAPERREVWYSDGTSGFYALRVAREVWARAMGPQALQLAVSPGRVTTGRRTRLRFAVRSGRTPVTGASVRIAGRTVRTDRLGRAEAVVRLRRTGLHTARATRRGYLPDSERVRAARGPSFAG